MGRVSKRGDFAVAIRYALTRWTALTRYADDGRIEVDNNHVKRAIRPIALGRKNWLFAGSDAGGARIAAIPSLIATARLNGIDPEAYRATCSTASPTTPHDMSPSCCRGIEPSLRLPQHYATPPDVGRPSSMSGRAPDAYPRPSRGERSAVLQVQPAAQQNSKAPVTKCRLALDFANQNLRMIKAVVPTITYITLH